MEVRKYTDGDAPAMVRIWNNVAEDGDAFPQEEFLDDESGKAFFAAQTYCGVAAEDGVVAGLYILHLNNVGRCAHIANTSYAVDAERRGGPHRRKAGDGFSGAGQAAGLPGHGVQRGGGEQRTRPPSL